jgi:ATPases involved in chromosome partitioning
MSRVIAIVNQKGGVGKTTSTINIGASLADRGKKVLLIDLDPQASLTTALGSKGISPTIYEVLKGENIISEIVLSHSNYFLVPSGIDLSGAELELSGVAGRECILKESLEEIISFYDFILIDCPPSLSLLTLNALVAANEIFIALQTEFLAMDGMNQLLSTVSLVQKRLNSKLIVKGIIATQYDARTGLHKEVYDTIKEHFGELVFKTPIRNTIALAESSSFGNDIFEYRPKSNGAKDYSDLVDEILI